MINFKVEGGPLTLGLNIVITRGKVKAIGFYWHSFNPTTEKSTVRRFRIRFNLKPYFSTGKHSWNRIDSYIFDRDLIVLTREQYEDITKGNKE